MMAKYFKFLFLNEDGKTSHLVFRSYLILKTTIFLEYSKLSKCHLSTGQKRIKEKEA